MVELKRGLSAVIFIFNEEEILEENMEELDSYLKKIGVKYEIILSENGSQDNTKEICKKLCKKYKHFRCILSPNPSIGEAIKRGLALARYDKTLVFPSDLWGLGFIPRALKMIENVDVVYGSRYIEGSKQIRPLIRKIISKCHTALVNLIYSTNFSDIDAVKMFKTEIGRKVLEKTKADGAFVEVEIAMIIYNSKLKYTEVPISHVELGIRHLKYIFKSVMAGAMNLVKNYSRLKKLKIGQ